MRTVYQPIIDLRTGASPATRRSAASMARSTSRRTCGSSRRIAAAWAIALEALAFERALADAGSPAGTYLTVNLSLSTLASGEVRACCPSASTAS